MNNHRIKNNPSIIGNRIKSLRMLAGYNRKAFSKKSGISAVTLRAWEEPRSDRNGITENGVARLIEAVTNCGISCSAEWLLQGNGSGPSLLHANNGQIIGHEQNVTTWDEEESIFKDIQSFKSNNQNPIVAIIIDGSMLPYYSYGDYVGGTKRVGKEIISLSGMNCIVELENLTLIRKLDYSENNNSFSLTTLNVEPSAPEPKLNNVNIISAAKIVWHRSREKIRTIIV